MPQIFSRLRRYFATGCLTLTILVASSSVLFAQGMGGAGVGAGSNPESENRKEPYKLSLKGFLNTKPEEGSLALVTLGISTFGETYKFDLTSVEAPDYPRLSSSMILQQVGKHDIDFGLIGPRSLLSKIGQAEPGTPLAIEGLFRPYNRTLQLESVQIIGME